MTVDQFAKSVLTPRQYDIFIKAVFKYKDEYVYYTPEQNLALEATEDTVCGLLPFPILNKQETIVDNKICNAWKIVKLKVEREMLKKELQAANSIKDESDSAFDRAERIQDRIYLIGVEINARVKRSRKAASK